MQSDRLADSYLVQQPERTPTDHAIGIEGGGVENQTSRVSPGQSADLTVELKAGQYEMYCPVDSHKDKGMKTEITVG